MTETFKALHIETRDKSVHIEHNGIKAFVPRSQIARMDIVGDDIDLTIPQWLYKEKFENGKNN